MAERFPVWYIVVGCVLILGSWACINYKYIYSLYHYIYSVKPDITSQFEITGKHAHVIQSQPKKVESLIDDAMKSEITKIMPIALDEKDKPRVQQIFEPFKDNLILSWGVHPVILPLQFGIITAPGISKRQGAIEIAKAINVPLENILGVGDSESDWQFMEQCGFVAVMGNAKVSFKQLAIAAKNDKCFIAPTVDENGIIDVFKHFELI